MTIAAGTKLGPYEIIAPIGAGGMGEVYRARDTRLDRTVAVKVLPSHLSENPEAKQRFDREARAISSLNHPNICTLFDVGHQDGVDYLVMEYLDGETLADRLAKGALPTEQVLKIGIEICEGLERAHRTGVVHRDLKPGNIMLTKSGAKLMDFGLAKAAAPAVSPATGLTMTMSTPAAGQPLTAHGSIMGTFHYMSPEQAEGKDADVRSDIFSLGAVLYEMASGRRAFEGKTTASVIAALLERDPQPISSVRPMSPPSLDRVVKTCLAKDPDDRFQNAHDVMLQLKWISEGGSQAGVPAPVVERRKNRERLGWALAAAFVLLAVGLVTLNYLRPRAAAPQPVLSYIPPPPDAHYLAFGFGSGPVVVSPDGTKIGYSAIDKSGTIKLWIRSLKANDAAPVAGTEGAAYPFWAPDSKSLGFFSGGKLKTIDLGNGSLQVLSDHTNQGHAAWSADGTILFRPADKSPLFRVSSSGGQATPVHPLDPSDYTESAPVALPDGRHYLAVVTSQKQAQRVEFKSLDSSTAKVLIEDADLPGYSDGVLLYIKNGKIYGRPFDPKAGTLSGEATPIMDAALYSAGGQLVLAFQAPTADSRLQWFDRNGNPNGEIGQVSEYYSPKISPDGKRVLASVSDSATDANPDLWAFPVDGGVSTKLTFGPGFKAWCVWSPDGKYIAYARKGADEKMIIVRKASDGSGSEETLVTMGSEIRVADAVDWSRDGRYLSFDSQDKNTGRFANWVLPVFGDRKPFRPAPVDANQFDGNFSPDGHWLAYFSYETGQPEVFIVPFPGPGGKYQISHGGGWLVRWDNKSNFYFFTPGNQLIEAEINFSGQSLQVKALKPLFQIDLLDTAAPLFDVSPDGQRMLAVTPARAESSSIGLLLNWKALLKK
jgi:Tol biopolymer transport system component